MVYITIPQRLARPRAKSTAERKPVSKIEGATAPRLVALQHKLNTKFVAMRDSRQDLTAIYGQLKLIERRLSALGVPW